MRISFKNVSTVGFRFISYHFVDQPERKDKFDDASASVEDEAKEKSAAAAAGECCKSSHHSGCRICSLREQEVYICVIHCGPSWYCLVVKSG